MRTAVDATRSLHKYVAWICATFEPGGEAGSEWEVRLWDQEGRFKPPFARVAKVGPVVYSGSSLYADLTQPMAVHLYPKPQQTSEDAEIRALAVTDMLYRGFREGLAYDEPLTPPRITAGYEDDPGTVAVGSYVYAVVSLNLAGQPSAVSEPFAVAVTHANKAVTLLWTPVAQAASFRVYRGANVGALGLIGTSNVPGFVDTGAVAPGAAPAAASAMVTTRGLPERVPLYDFDAVPLDGPESDSTLRHPSDYLRIVAGSLSINSLADPVDDRLRTIIADMRVTWRRQRTITGKPVKSLVTAFDPVS